MKYQRGFTMIELMVVVTIVVILAAVVTANIMGRIADARDTVRINDIGAIQIALRLYADNHGSFAVADTGSSGGGQGWFAYVGGAYSKSISEGLVDEGLLPSNLADPLVPHGSAGSSSHRQYMHYFVTGGANSGSCIFAQLENPGVEHTEAFNLAMEKVSVVYPQTYGMNYGACTDLR